MHIGIHTGLGGHFGMGHAVRCKTLASALVAQGADVEFLTQTPALAAFVAPLPCHLYRHVWPAWPIEVVVEDVPCQSPDAWYALLRQRYRVVRVDVPTATPKTCDLLIAPCAHWHPDVVQGLSAAFGDRLLYGWDYVLLDEAVTQMPPVRYGLRVDGPVVFCAGGSDPTHALERMALWMGEAVQDREWMALVPAYGGPRDLPVWMKVVPFARDWLREAALIVTTWGVTVYEALWFGTPLCTVTAMAARMADAQHCALASGHALVSLGNLGCLDACLFAATVTDLAGLPRQRARMHEASRGLLDGKGAQRAASAILALED